MVICIQWADGGSDLVRDCGSIQQAVSMVFEIYRKHHNNIYRLTLCEDSGIIIKEYAKGGRWVG